MSLPLLRRQARQPRRVLSVSDHWRRDESGAFRRLVLVREPSGEVSRGWMLDDAPALVAYLAAVAA